MMRKTLAALAVATMLLAGCGLRGDPAVPPAKSQASLPAAASADTDAKNAKKEPDQP